MPPKTEDDQEVGGGVMKLNDGNTMPMLGYGLGTVMHKASRDQKNQAIVEMTRLAIEYGCRHLDCAELYNNEELGDAVRASSVPRSEIFVVTKLCGTEKRDVKAEFQGSLNRLGLDYVDLYLVHGPYMADNTEDLQLDQLAYPTFSVNSIEYHPYLQRGTLVEFLKKHNIAVSAYSILTALTELPPGRVDELYTKLANKYNVTEADVALRWCMDQQIAAITTTRSEERLKAYCKNIPTFSLTKDEIDNISRAGQFTHYRKFLTDRFAWDDRR
ncbi:alcohol dehydrogenase [Fusarium beomiforme]|uniref:Alcohol dehydrogenase n=1 Tax=Fusarium beomiforme TaxID=44412 RepID=A0A9P5A7L9_9HYPO|nr:alcohol dehydrogenase [Fusarium beomiforme]